MSRDGGPAAAVRMGTRTTDGRPDRLGLGGQLLFSVGQFGWSLTTFLANNLLAYFYLPPETGGEGIPALVPRGAVLGFLTVVGAAAFAARLFDAVNDPLIAGLSDRSRSRFGRRRSFMAVGALPAVALALAQFFPPSPSPSAANVAWLLVTALAGTVFLTMYVMPYNALIAELGRDSRDRLRLSAMTSVAWAIGFAAGNATYALKDLFGAAGAGPAEAFRGAILVLGALAAAAMLVPVLAIDERRFARSVPSSEAPFAAVKLALRDRPFRVLVGASFLYYAANTFLEIGIAYYVTVLLGLRESDAFLLAALVFGASFLWYPLVLAGAARIGRKRSLLAGFAAQVLVFAAVAVMGFARFVPAAAWLGFIVLFQSAASAAFGILPTAMVADSARARSLREGRGIEGAYFGVNSFAMKAAVSTANLAFPSLLLLGRSVERPLGLVLSGLVAALLTTAGLVVLLRYDESALARGLEGEGAGA